MKLIHIFLSVLLFVMSGCMSKSEPEIYSDGNGFLIVNGKQNWGLKDFENLGYKVTISDDEMLWGEEGRQEQSYYVFVENKGVNQLKIYIENGSVTYLSIETGSIPLVSNGKVVRIGDSLGELFKNFGNDFDVYEGEISNYITFENMKKVSFSTDCNYHSNIEMMHPKYSDIKPQELLVECKVSEYVIAGQKGMSVDIK